MHNMTPGPVSWRPTPLLAFSILLHIAAAMAILLNPGSWRWPVCAVIVNHLVLTAISMWPRSRLLGPNWTRLPAAAAARGEVALTIDDGPDPNVTPQVLELLDTHGVHATFFCIGRNVARYPNIAREIVRRGHAMENHSDQHRWYFAFLGVGGFRRELASAQATITDVTGQAPLFFRAPAGMRSPLLDPALCQTGLRLASWTRRGFDTVERNPDTVLRRLLANLRGGDILLVHDGNAAHTGTGEPVILAVLPQLLLKIRAAGLTAVTLRAALR
jgi:peptidoglycan/xylan/chitin deacetylase (PgdA/CDA1 family)